MSAVARDARHVAATSGAWSPRRAVVVGLAATGEAVVRRLAAEGWSCTVVEDHPGTDVAYTSRVGTVRALGAGLVEEPEAGDWPALVRDVDLLVPSPGVASAHPGLRAAAAEGVPVRSEVDLAAERLSVPLVAVTGTNGKTTVTTLATEMLVASGVRALAAGNIGRPLLDVVDEVAEGAADVVVAEVSSFQLEHTTLFRPRVAVLLGIAPDHLDAHGSFEAYVAAKSRIFAAQRGDDLLVYDADDSVASKLALDAPARVVGVTRVGLVAGAYHRRADDLVAPGGRVIVPVAALARALPHDVTDALAAAAAALDVGATTAGVGAALRAFRGLPHRVTLVGEAGGVRWYDDSKATNPHAAVHALASFDSAVLLAGGRNKGLDLGALAAEAGRVRAVVALGEAAGEVEAAFRGVRPVVTATSMREAVRTAASLAAPGDVVLLSPGCASFDWYESYAARGDDFAAEVHRLLEEHDGDDR